jgi:hypothetical protein
MCSPPLETGFLGAFRRMGSPLSADRHSDSIPLGKGEGRKWSRTLLSAAEGVPLLAALATVAVSAAIHLGQRLDPRAGVGLYLWG